MKKRIGRVFTKIMVSIMLIVSVLSVFMLGGCSINGQDINVNLTELQTPGNIAYNEGTSTVSWSSVNNCDGYIVKINESEYNVDGLSYAVSFNESCSFTFSVKARGRSLYSTDSPWSEPKTYQFVKSNTPTEPPQRVNWDDANVSNGIGRTVSAIDGKYGFMTSEFVSPFDKNKLYSMPLYSTSWSSSESSSTISESVSDTITNISVGLQESVNVGNTNASTTSTKLFRKGFSQSFKANYSYKKSTQTKEIYYYFNNTIAGKLVEIEGRSDIEAFQNIVTESYLSDAQQVVDENSAKQFLRKYGTHVVTAGIFGAKAEYFYIYSYESSKVEHKADAELKASFTMHLAKLKSITTEMSASFSGEFGWNDEKSVETFNAKLRGGDPVDCTSYQSLKDNYQSWLNSFANGNYNELVDFPSRSLVSVWDLLPKNGTYSSAKTFLENTTNKLMDEEFQKNMDAFNEERDENCQDGSEAYPYKITNAQELSDIRNKDGKLGEDRVYFKLANDIDMTGVGDWTPMETFFGELDGDGHVIKNLEIKTISSLQHNPKTKAENGYYSGFINVNYGTVKNLKFEGAVIEASKKENTSSERNIFIGLVAAFNTDGGKISNIEINGPKIDATMSADDKCSKDPKFTSFCGGVTGYNMGSVNYCVVKDSEIYMYTNGGNNHSLPSATICGGIVGENVSKCENIISDHNIVKSKSRGGYYKAGKGGGRVWSWSGYVIGINNGTLDRAVSYGHAKDSLSAETQTCASYMSNIKNWGLICGSMEKGQASNVYAVKMDDIRIVGDDKSACTDAFVNETDAIRSKVGLWTNWKYDDGHFSFVFA